jgi:transposase
LKDLPRPPGPDPEPGWRFLFDLDPRTLENDPVMRQLLRHEGMGTEQLARIAAAALSHPPAARLLRSMAHRAQITETTLVASLPELDGLAARTAAADASAEALAAASTCGSPG